MFRSLVLFFKSLRERSEVSQPISWLYLDGNRLSSHAMQQKLYQLDCDESGRSTHGMPKVVTYCSLCS